MDKRYLLTITSLLASTLDVHQEIVFASQLPSGKVSLEACLVQLRVCNGALLSYEFKEVTGRPLLFQQEQAIDILASLGMLEWYRPSFLAQEREEIHEHLPARQSAPYSHQASDLRPIRKNSNASLNTLDPIHRRVFLLVDGSRSVQHIAKLLSKHPEEILGILHDLQEQNVISF